MIPNVAVLQIESPHCHMPTLWLPLFLLWIPLILLSPLILFVILAACIAGRVSFWKAIATFLGILCALRGLNVRVTTYDSKVLVRIL
ncbi:MAG: hypothetical protein ABR865_03145 [Terracidiphilus sp.]|jgi:hypothetical protein